MTWSKSLLDELEHFVEDLIDVSPLRSNGRELATRLDVLQRVIELLRLRAGRLESELPMHELLAARLSVVDAEQSGGQRITFGSALNRVPSNTRPRRQSELQAALLLHLLHARSKHARIGDDLHQFILAVGDDLAPADVESTRTGVMRIATTTRDAARALRLHGLLRDSDETRTRTWELSLLGILTAVALSETKPTRSLPPLAAFADTTGRFGESKRLSQDVETVVGNFDDELRVRDSLLALVTPDKDVFVSFQQVVRTLTKYCMSLSAHWRALDERHRTLSVKELRAAADAMLSAVESAVIPKVLAEDVNKSLSFRQLPGFKPRARP